MISRRHIRVKVMQSVYALTTSHSDNLVKEEKFIRASVDKMFDLYVLQISLFIELKKLAKKLHKASSNSRLKIGAQESSTKFIDNLVLESFETSSSVSIYEADHALNQWRDHDEYIRMIYDEMIDSEIFAIYMNDGESSFKKDRKFIEDLFVQIIAPNEKLADFYEDTFIGWVDDIPFVNSWMLKTIKDLKKDKTFILPALYKNDEDEQFAVKLFRKVVLNQEAYEQEIVKKTPNWELERIAEIDVILLKLGIAEFLEFPSIPVRVTINEYIELSKDYSSNKSNVFINGVLDKLQKDFSESKRMKKMGRGLL
jgi:N utilization substance protein B